jgi:hypothetical protein
MALQFPLHEDSIQTLPQAAVEMYPKKHDPDVSSSGPSIELRENVPEKINNGDSNHVHDPGLPAWRLFVIIGG